MGEFCEGWVGEEDRTKGGGGGVVAEWGWGDEGEVGEVKGAVRQLSTLE